MKVYNIELADIKYRYLAVIIFGIVSLADYVTTLIALDLGAIEGNPLMEPLFTANPLYVLFIKLFVIIYAVVLMFYFAPKTAYIIDHPKRVEFSALLLVIPIVVVGFIVVLNIAVILSLVGVV